MNKRYMDFVPVKPVVKKPEVVLPRAETSLPAETAPRPTKTPRSAEASASRIAGPTEVDEFAISEIFEERTVHTPAGVTRGSARLGVIQDLGPRFVKTEVEKRALGQPSPLKPAAKVEAEQELKELKSEKLVGHSATHSALTGKKLSAADGAMTAINASVGANTKANTNAQATLQVPKFVNLEKVKKRPLSKNVYTKPVAEPTEIPKGPVTIIAKPEKDSRAGMIVAVIITIILGATAGTVAFLLLPK